MADMVDKLCGAENAATDAVAETTSPSIFTDEDLLLQRYYSHVDVRGDSTYLTQPIPGGNPKTYTFKDVEDQAARMAAHIQSLGLAPESKIGIVSKNCAHFMICELAIWMAGHVTVAVYPTLSADGVKYIFEHSEAKLVFVGKLDDGPWNGLKSGIPDDLPCISFPLAPEGVEYETWDSIITKTEPISGRPTRKMDDQCLIVYTSGSTGTPKGVLHSFRTISETTKLFAEYNKATPEDRVLSYLPMAHVFDRLASATTSIYAGYQVFFAESLPTFVADLNRCRPTLFVSVPRLWLKFQGGVFSKMPPWKLDILLKIPFVSTTVKKKILTSLGLNTVRMAGSGSAPIPHELITWYRSLGLELLEGYGMTENFCYSHATRPKKGLPGFIGQPFPGVDCKLSEEGEILVKSPGTMVGYYKADDLTAEVMTEDGYLKTGDRGFIDDQQRLKITGRVKELFKTSKGKYVAPSPIENIINNNTNVELSLVGGSGRVMTMAVVQLAENLIPKVESDADVKKKVTADLTKLLGEVNGAIEEYEKVGFIVIAKNTWTVENELLTPTMKIKRTAIENLYEDKLDGWYDLKQKVIWEE